MTPFIDKSLGRKLLLAVGLPSLVIAAAGILWLRAETATLAPHLHEAVLGAVVVLALAMSAAHLLAVRLLVEKPLQRLEAGMRRAEEGDFLYRVPVESADELGQLAQRYNSTLAAITDLHALRLEDAQSLESLQRELGLKRELEAQHRLVDEANRRLKARLQELTLLHDLGRTLASTLHLDELLRYVVEHLGQELGYERFVIFLADETTGDLVAHGSYGIRAELTGSRLPPGEGVAQGAAAAREAILVRDTSVEPRLEGSRVADSQGTLVAIPMLYKGECVGVLDLFRPAVDAFSEEELRLLQSVASQAAMAIANARMHAKALGVEPAIEAAG
ncbi:MAG TPA: GAF domain-containing protein [Anaeromyxobacteraceae bacterium]|jgi:nitrate/nitrite-specific signal transduction histidine kinase|nr:GAF domain-containing protein [Anaeromyxobacteraceae bacterium]